MEAQVGDELIIEGPEPGTSGRIGTIVALQNADGSPPYVVHWLAGDYDSLIRPGPTARIKRHCTSLPSSRSLVAAGAASARAPTWPGPLHPLGAAAVGGARRHGVCLLPYGTAGEHATRAVQWSARDVGVTGRDLGPWSRLAWSCHGVVICSKANTDRIR
jgi:hypothetical protein